MIDPTVNLMRDTVCERTFNKICKTKGFAQALEYLREKIEDIQLCREKSYEENRRYFKGN